MDVVISRSVSTCSRSLAAAAINKGYIRVSEQRKRPGYRMKTGDQVTGEIRSDAFEISVESDPRSLDVIHADSHILVLNKPSGLVVHPGAGCKTNTLVNRLLYHFPELRQVGEDPARPGIVHRLDKDTSGLILVARTSHSLQFLQKEFKYHRVEKTYLALVAGSDLAESGEIISPIGRHPRHRRRMCVNLDTGKPARTSWQVIQRFAGACLVKIHLYTGRTHQIRVHFYDMGYPLLGDLTYQFRRNRKKLQPHPRQMLHAWQMGFRHPFSGRKMGFEVDPPQDFISAAAREAGIGQEDGVSEWKRVMAGPLMDKAMDKAATVSAATPPIQPVTKQ
ncbi:MAG: RluA family pseudouridine synthase [Desulfotignum sp.]|nr:RluA family pseudouridine synthase [Desulfotignum sp.]